MRPEPLTVRSDGLRLAGRLYRPAGCPKGSLLVGHGAGSRKENHAVMGEQAAAAGLAALTFDFRGHGQSDGVMGRQDAVALRPLGAGRAGDARVGAGPGARSGRRAVRPRAGAGER